MTVILCVDENFNLLFNNRRVSKDEFVIKDIIDVFGLNIQMNSYSLKMFQEYGFDINLNSEIHFIESIIDLNEYNEIMIYNFNRSYPSDVKVDISIFFKVEEIEFSGRSHDKITRSLYRRKEV